MLKLLFSWVANAGHLLFDLYSTFTCTCFSMKNHWNLWEQNDSFTYIHYFDPAERLQITSLFQTEHLILTNVGQAGRLNFFSLRSHPPSAYQVRKESTLCELYCVQYSNLYTCFSRFWNIYQRVTSWKGHVYNHSYTVKH